MKPNELLANSLEVLKQLQDEKGVMAIRSRDLSRVHRERLLKFGFLKEVLKGWYIPSRPDELQGESTSWYASFWDFIASYLTQRFGEEWCLSAEQSVLLLMSNTTVPEQVIVRAPDANNNTVSLLHNTLLIDLKVPIPKASQRISHNRLQLYALPIALCSLNQRFYQHYPVEASAAYFSIQDISPIVEALHVGGHASIGGRIVGGFRHVGRHKMANDLMKALLQLGYEVKEENPFEHQIPVLHAPNPPHIQRLVLLWESMSRSLRNTIDYFPIVKSVNKQLDDMDDCYLADAYHSLSIEGYKVNSALLNKVRQGQWNPDSITDDARHRDALAARGYWLLHEEVKKAVKRIAEGKDPVAIIEAEHMQWYQTLFSPSVQVGILRPSDIAGYRNAQVYIRQSRHIPYPPQWVSSAMQTYFELLRNESDPAIRAILGHFFFGYIHPFMDGNGRLARFLMNILFISSGYPWVIVEVHERLTYMKALETASTEGNIKPFASFITSMFPSNQLMTSEPKVWYIP